MASAHPSLWVPWDNFTLLWFNVSCCPLSLRNSLILNPLWQKRQLCEFPLKEEGRAQEGTDRRAVMGSWTWVTLLDLKGFHLPSSWTPWLWVISITMDLQTRLVPREAPKHYFLNFHSVTQKKKKEKKKKSRVLRKSLMRSGHVRTVQKAPLFIQILTVVPETMFATPNLMEAGRL